MCLDKIICVTRNACSKCSKYCFFFVLWLRLNVIITSLKPARYFNVRWIISGNNCVYVIIVKCLNSTEIKCGLFIGFIIFLALIRILSLRSSSISHGDIILWEVCGGGGVAERGRTAASAAVRMNSSPVPESAFFHLFLFYISFPYTESEYVGLWGWMTGSP